MSVCVCERERERYKEKVAGPESGAFIQPTRWSTTVDGLGSAVLFMV